ncbi:MAG: HDOD domain-containing protein [Leptospiraceae bacterium]|nr:HDOD domain-containing protein [Leptospiraceae bacterium]MCP5501676.1 HDOD domain-containing protein [Leptospiraceae bacterium]
MNPKDMALGINPKNYLSYNVMVVSSAKQDREHLIRILLRKEFSMTSAVGDTRIAVEVLENLPELPEILFVDIEEYALTALRNLKKIRETYPDIKIVVISKNAEKDLIKDLVQLKVNTFILKPFDDKIITEKMAQVLGRKDLAPKEEFHIYQKSQIDLRELKLPSLPGVIMQVLRVNTEDPEVGCRELEKLISPDKAISSSVIRLANSAFYGRSGSIETLKDAITLLGVNTIKNLVFLQAKKNLYGELKEKLYKRFLHELPILSALICFDLSNILGLKKQGEYLFLYSLLGRIGMTVFAMNFPKKYLETLRFFEFGIKDLTQAEMEMFTTNSQYIGHKIFKLWKMPEGFLDSIAYQNFTLEELDTVPDVSKAIRLGELFALKLLGVILSQEEQELEKGILTYFKKEEVSEMFGDEYYELILDHPLYAMAMS